MSMSVVQSIGGTLMGGFLRGCQNIGPVGGASLQYGVPGTYARVTDAVSAQYSAADLACGWIIRTDAPANAVDMLPEATDLLTSAPFASLLPSRGSWVDVYVRFDGGTDTMTFVGDTGTTVAAPTLAVGEVCRLRIVRASNPGETDALHVTGEKIVAASVDPQPSNTPNTVVTVSAEEAATYTAAQISGGVILRDPGSADRTDVTPTAAQLIAGLGLQPGQTRDFLLINTAAGANSVTLTGGAGVTVYNYAVLAQNHAARVTLVYSGTGQVDAIVQSAPTPAS